MATNGPGGMSTEFGKECRSRRKWAPLKKLIVVPFRGALGLNSRVDLGANSVVFPFQPLAQGYTVGFTHTGSAVRILWFVTAVDLEV